MGGGIWVEVVNGGAVSGGTVVYTESSDTLYADSGYCRGTANQGNQTKTRRYLYTSGTSRYQSKNKVKYTAKMVELGCKLVGGSCTL